ncbi:MAG: hypothetical protein HOV81_10790 [Kofleriaceae bacterium]|nr:hypothetical protein [Kofleriaceae bacterium]
MSQPIRAPLMAMHAPSERVVAARLGTWEVRRHAETGARHGYFATRGLLHLQLWHPAARVSILTPSRLTNDRFEVWRDGVRFAVRAWSEVAEILSDLALPDGERVALPGGAEVAALHAWMIVRDAVAARRASATRTTVIDAGHTAPALAPVRS